MPPTTRSRRQHRIEQVKFKRKILKCNGPCGRAGVLDVDMCDESCYCCNTRYCKKDSIYIIAEFGASDVFYRVGLLCKPCLHSKNWQDLTDDKYPGIQFICGSWPNGRWGLEAVERKWCFCCRQTVPTKQCADCSSDVCRACCRRAFCGLCRATHYLKQRAFKIQPDEEHPEYAGYHVRKDTKWTPSQ